MIVDRVRKPRIMLTLISFIKTVFALAELFIITRVILDFFGASPAALFVQWMHLITDPLLRPFIGTFPALLLDSGFVIEFHALLALIVYAFVGYLITEGLGVLAVHRSLWRKYPDSDK